MTPDLTARIQHLVANHFPGSSLQNCQLLKGGISSLMIQYSITTTSGETQTYIAREPCEHARNQNSKAAEHEYRCLQAIRSAGISCPTPILLETDARSPFIVLEHIEGAPLLNPSNPDSHVKDLAETLAQIHLIDTTQGQLDFFPRTKVTAPKPWAEPNEDLQESETRTLLDQLPLPKPKTVLRHGDFWPGNVLCRNEQIVAVIDWEITCLGHPLADLGMTRLDILWSFGESAMHTFTDHYFHLTHFNRTDLPYFDLRATLLPVQQLPQIAESYQTLGRLNITYEKVKADYLHFLQLAKVSL